MAELPSEVLLAKLPHAAQLAYAARAARRVYPIFASGVKDEKLRAAVTSAIELSLNDAATGVHATDAVADAAVRAAAAADSDAYGSANAAYAVRTAAYAANAAAFAARASANLSYSASYVSKAAANAIRAAARTVSSGGEDARIVKAMLNDYRLLALAVRTLKPQSKEWNAYRLNAGESGPLGPLWTETPPSWFQARHPLSGNLTEVIEQQLAKRGSGIMRSDSGIIRPDSGIMRSDSGIF